MTSGNIEVVRKPIEGFVAAIVSERELAINIGSNHGVYRGMKFKVVASGSTEIDDPITGERLGGIIRTKVRVKTELVSERFSTCKTYRNVPGGFGNIARFLTSTQGDRPETLRAEDSDFIADLSEEESFVKIGDKAIQILEGDALTIKEAENTLQKAVMRGVVKGSDVEEAVNNWKSADDTLEEAREKGKDSQEIEGTLEELNHATSRITNLLNRVNSTDESD